MEEVIDFFQNNKGLLYDYDEDAINTLYSLIEDSLIDVKSKQIYDRCKEYYELIENATSIEEININKKSILTSIQDDTLHYIYNDLICYIQIEKLLTEFEINTFSIEHMKILSKLYHLFSEKNMSKIHIKWINEHHLQFIKKEYPGRKCDIEYIDNTFFITSQQIDHDGCSCGKHWKPPNIIE